MFAEAIEDILRDKCLPSTVRAIESGEDGTGLWGAFRDAGFLELLTPEAQGGAGLTLPEVFPVLLQFGRYVVPLPMAQAVVARGLVAADVRLPDGRLTLAPQLVRRSNGQLACTATPFGVSARHVLAADGAQLLLLDAAKATRTQAGGAESHLAILEWNDDSHAQRLRGDGTSLAPMAAALHATLIAGAMARVFEMTLAFCNERQQFGKPLGKFQAVQHQLSVMAEQVASVAIAAEAAFETGARTPSLIRAAVAKARASDAVVLVSNTAHALHGAIGITAEYDLQLYTRRLHEWRMAHGAETYWNRIVGEQVLASPLPVAEFVRA